MEAFAKISIHVSYIAAVGAFWVLLEREVAPGMRIMRSQLYFSQS